MTTEQKAEFLRQQEFNLQKEKAPEQFENSYNNLILLKNEEKINDEFKEKFKGTGYILKNNCTHLQVYSKQQDKIVEKLLCNFVAFIDEEITVDDGLETHKILKIRGKHEQGYDLPGINVPERNFSSMNWITGMWNAKCIVETGQSIRDNIRCCIQKISKDIKDKTIFSFTGWKKLNGKWIYLHSGGAVGADNIEVVLDGRLAKYKFPESSSLNLGNSRKIFDDFINIAPKKIILPLLAFVFLTPLNEFLRRAGYEPNFVYYLLGKTGCGKSTISALFLSFFGNFSSAELPMSFLDTANAIVSKAFAIKDSLICIDDYKPSNRSDVNIMDKTAQNLVRSYGERTGRQRLKADSTDMKQKYPRGNAILTGERLRT